MLSASTWYVFGFTGLSLIILTTKSRNGNLIACGYDDGSIYVYSVDTGRLAFSLSGHTGPIRCVKFSPAGSILAAGGESKVVSLYSMESGEHVANMSGHDAWIMYLDWNETGEYILTAAYDGKSKVWSVESRSAVATQNDSKRPLLCCGWLNKGWGPAVIGGMNEGFVTVGDDRTIRWYREAAGSMQ